MNLGEKIAKLRKEHQYTQEQLAEKMNVSRQTISKWENTLAYPETDKLIQLSQLFHCSLDYLLLPSNEHLDRTPQTKTNPLCQNTSCHSSIWIKSKITQQMVCCFKLIASPVFHARKDQPKFLLLAVDKITLWGEHTTQLGWYQTELEIQKEIQQINTAIKQELSTYTLQYTVEVETKLFDIVIKTPKS